MDNNIIGPVSEYLRAYRSQQVKGNEDGAKNQVFKGGEGKKQNQGPDTLELSSVAKKLKTGNVEEVRNEKVEHLKEKINQGNYTIDSGKIAEKIMEESGLDRRV